MRLTLHTDYALRMLMLLASRPDERVTIQEVADANGISKNHLMKIAQDLAKAGFIESTRGKGGGLRLARAAKQIRLGDVVRTTEPDFSYVECMSPRQSDCRLLPACRLMHVLADAGRAFQAELDKVSLADIIVSPQRLSALLPDHSASD